MFSFKKATAILIAAGAALSYAGIQAVGALSGGVNDLANIAQVQQISIASDGMYAPSLESLTDGSLGLVVEPVPESQVAYAVNSDRSHFLVATLAPGSDMVVIQSDTASRAVTCESLTLACVSEVTDDAELLAASPTWTQF